MEEETNATPLDGATANPADNGQTKEEQESTPSVSHVSIQLKLPPFWPHDPLVWFAQVEAQFDTKNIKSQATRFSHVVSSLQPEYAQEVRDILISPPKKDRYDTLKSELIRRTSASEQKRLQQLLTAEELGDRTPSQLLRRMQQLLGTSNIDENIFKQLFLQRLPTNIQLILASTRDSMDIHKLSEVADKIMETNTHVAHGTTIAALSSAPTDMKSQTMSAELKQLQAQLVAQLTAQVQTLTTMTSRSMMSGRSRSWSKPREQSRGRQGNPNRNPNTQTSPQDDGLCWYHGRHGANAHKCVAPCSFASNPPESRPAQAQGNDQTSG